MWYLSQQNSYIFLKRKKVRKENKNKVGAFLQVKQNKLNIKMLLGY